MTRSDGVGRDAARRVAELLAEQDQLRVELAAATRLALSHGATVELLAATGMARSTLYRLAQVPGRDGRSDRGRRRGPRRMLASVRK